MLTSYEATKIVLKNLDRVLNDVSIGDALNYFLLRGERVCCGEVGLVDFATKIHLLGSSGLPEYMLKLTDFCKFHSKTSKNISRKMVPWL